MKKRYLALIGTIVFSLFRTIPVFACSCGSAPSPCAHFKISSAVFVGEVIRIEEDKAEIERAGEKETVRTGLRAYFSIESAFKGVSEKQRFITVATGGGNGDCGYDFKSGQRYIVFANGMANSESLITTICSRTQPLPEGQDYVDLIQALIKGSPFTRIFGTAVLYGRMLGTGPFDMKALDKPVGLQIEARGEAGVFSTITDDTGRFRLSVPPGKYMVTPILPPEVSGFLGKDVTTKATIDLPTNCGADVRFLLQINGVVSGTIFTVEGKPVNEGVEVSLLTAESAVTGKLVGSSTWTKAGGTYQFDGLVPGNYIIGVGILHPPGWGSPYAGVFYPSAEAISGARVISVGKGQQILAADIFLPEPMNTADVYGIVSWPDGRRASGASIEVFDLDSGRVVEVPQILFQTDTDGFFSVTAMAGRRYEVRAYIADNYLAGTGVQSEYIQLTTRNENAPILLTLSQQGIARKKPQ